MFQKSIGGKCFYSRRGVGLCEPQADALVPQVSCACRLLIIDDRRPQAGCTRRLCVTPHISSHGLG